MCAYRTWAYGKYSNASMYVRRSEAFGFRWPVTVMTSVCWPGVYPVRVAKLAKISGDRDGIVASLRSEGLLVTHWDDQPDSRYERHAHPQREVRVVLAGGMTIVVGGRTFDMGPFDRLDLDPGEVHSARVHAGGVTYLAGRAQ